MFILFRAVFITAIACVAFVAQASPISPLTRYMLDVIPEGTENGADVDTNAVAAKDPSAPLSPHSDVPVAADSSPVPDVSDDSDEHSAESSPSDVDNAPPSAGVDAKEDTKEEPSSSPPESSDPNVLVSQTNAAGRIGGLGGAGILLSSVVAGILLA